MAYENVKEFPLANIVRVEIETEEVIPKMYRLTDVATEATITAFVSAGNEQELRVKNVIKAQNKTEDIVKGYDVNLISATMIAEILALVDGGTLRTETTGVEPDIVTLLKGYDAPVVGAPVNRTPFTAKIYAAEKDVDGTDISYVCFKYLHCKGKPVNYSVKDGEFFAPELAFNSRPKMGEVPVAIDFLNVLPA